MAIILSRAEGLLHLIGQTCTGEANEDITLDYFDYFSDWAAGGNRRIQDDILSERPGLLPGRFLFGLDHAGNFGRGLQRADLLKKPQRFAVLLSQIAQPLLNARNVV